MRRIFNVELSAPCKPGTLLCTDLDLPAQPWALQDALDKLETEDRARITTEICQYYDYEYLGPVIRDNPDLCELNALALRLAALEQWQDAAFEGLLQMKAGGKQEKLPTKQLLDLAASVDCCHVVPEALNDSQLGYFYAKNGFIPEVEHVPDSVFDLLDFEQLGRKARIAEEGVYTEHGYVMQHDELKQAPPIPEGPPQKPPYIFRLILDNYPFDEENHKPLRVPLDLPATEEELDAALGALDAPSWEEVVIVDYDGAVPDLESAVDCFLGIDQINELADLVKQIIDRDELSKFKAVLEAVECTELDDMVKIASQLDQYILEPDHQTYEDIALSDLRVIAGESALKLLEPHVNLYNYGQAVAEKMNIALGSYGTVSRRDGQPIQTFNSDGPQQGGMEVTM